MEKITGFFKQFVDKKQYVIYGYHPPMKAKYVHDVVTEDWYLKHKDFYEAKYEVGKDPEYGDGYVLYDVLRNPDGSIVDFRTVEKFKDQLDCGMNVLFLQSNAVTYDGEEFSTSELKYVLDVALEAGFERKVVFRDERLHSLSASTVPIVGDGARFSSFDELVEYCRQCISQYESHPAFGGVYLLDEPKWKELPALCLVYRALTSIDENMFIQFNLLPMAGDANAVTGTGKTSAELFVDVSLAENKGITVAQAYRKYLESFAAMSGANNITMDSYPVREQGPYADLGKYSYKDFYINGNAPEVEKGYYIMETHFPTLQNLAEVCRNNGCMMGGLSNTCAMHKVRDNGDRVLVNCYKAPDEADMRYQLNAYIAYGTKIFSYYTYWAKKDNGPGCYHVENTTFIAQDGTKLPLYYVMKKLHAEMQERAAILYDYDYSAMTYVGNPEYLENCVKNELIKVKRATLLSGEAAIITELKSNDGKLIYCVYNPSAPSVNGESVRSEVLVEFDGAVKRLVGTKLEDVSASGKALTVELGYGGIEIFFVS